MNDSALTVDSQRVELVTARAQIEVLKGQIESYDKESRELHERLTIETTAADATRQAVDGRDREVGGADQPGHRARTPGRSRRPPRRKCSDAASRSCWPGSTSRAASWPSASIPSDSLRTEASSAQKTVLDLRAELAEAENRRRAATEALETERTTLENQLKQSQDERDKLQNEIASMKREVEATWATERMENAVLRERINDVAAEVARLTSVLEGPGSPIDAILAGDAARHGGSAGAGRDRRRRQAATAKAPGARSPTASGRCKAAPRRCRSRAAPDISGTAPSGRRQRA